MPGEFEPHAGCWMAWPTRADNWRLNAKPAQAAFTAVATAIAEFEPVTMLVQPGLYVTNSVYDMVVFVVLLLLLLCVCALSRFNFVV